MVQSYGNIVVYDRNHYFGLGPIPKPKPKLADTFGRYRNWYETKFQQENLVTDSMGYFFHHKRTPEKFAAKYQILLDYFLRSGFIFKHMFENIDH